MGGVAIFLIALFFYLASAVMQVLAMWYVGRHDQLRRRLHFNNAYRWLILWTKASRDHFVALVNNTNSTNPVAVPE